MTQKGSLTENQINLNNTMFNNPTIFNKENNCFLQGVRGIAETLDISSHTTITRQFDKLKKLGLLKMVKVGKGHTRGMINPLYYWEGEDTTKHFAKALYHFGTIKQALAFDLLQRDFGYYLNPFNANIVDKYDYTATRDKLATVFEGDRITPDLVRTKIKEIEQL
ncbi:hypothetical protein RA178_06205 [Shewanella oncorhynchi]|uniref:Uncharacterized protein n=1 Tax=Shewanella oncorhynchi TaxID=2726434 RepID=A0AA50KFF0_9GAMM|nr:hypothetical protein [Shewanella oncorhynchi]WMB74204.1 hypothetical protein RA178_06205 [Shewanella oncorhynchi]